ncbi:Hypothetical predicted protein [Mytilus galloprovincialis]|uniref:Uncharacterized protein n=1 Tax=Mytilus galloprovincialis TaxID=29158 RepID=A0A8B6G2J6_MYTGA|nr:Hypothetical predicted protein [Mytilus galloprovincialis]
MLMTNSSNVNFQKYSQYPTIQLREQKSEEKMSQLSADDLRDMVLSMFDKDPSIMLNIVDRNSQTEIQGYHPRPESNAPSWCVCTKCIELRRRRNDAGKHHKI